MSANNLFNKFAAALGIVVTLTACSGTQVKFGPMSGVKYDASRGRQVTAEACGFQLMLLIPINTNTRAERAFRSLRSQAGSDFLTDVKVRERWTYAFVGTIYCTSMEGTAYPQLPS
jgi:hypothetical protein